MNAFVGPSSPIQVDACPLCPLAILGTRNLALIDRTGPVESYPTNWPSA